jgi:hypothetical protein
MPSSLNFIKFGTPAFGTGFGTASRVGTGAGASRQLGAGFGAGRQLGAGFGAARQATRAAAPSSRLIGIADKDAASLGKALKRIEIDGKPAVESVEAFGSRAGSTYRGRPPTPESDLDIYVTVRSGVANSPAKLKEVQRLGGMLRRPAWRYFWSAKRLVFQ